MQAGREIKFQVWDQDAKKMWTWEDIDAADKKGILRFLDMLVQDQFIPRRFTGLRDKNGKEIYEGDIVDLRDHPFEGPMKINGVYEVGYNERMELCCGSLLLHREIPYITVIGNIYENRDLLEVGNNASRT